LGLGPSDTVCEPPSVWKRTYDAVARRVLALAGDAHERVEELLVVLLAGGELVLDDEVARREDDVAQALDARSVCGSSSDARSISRARSAVAGESSSASPPSSPGRRARACSIHGNAASIVAGVSRTPGRISVANARVGGNAALSESNALLALRSVGASSRIVARRFVDSPRTSPSCR
jgi:hypothetical protein